jgi:hypothetical protein
MLGKTLFFGSSTDFPPREREREVLEEIRHYFMEFLLGLCRPLPCVVAGRTMAGRGEELEEHMIGEERERGREGERQETMMYFVGIG